MDSTKCADEPFSAWDYALLGAVMAASVPFIAANIVVLLHRRRKFFRAQGGALLILTSSIAGLTWIAAAFISDLHFPPSHRFLRICPLWILWLQFALGYWLWFACQALRLIHLYYLCQNAAASTYSSRCRMLFWALLLWTPSLTFTIAATASDASHSRLKVDTCAGCEMQTLWMEWAYFILPLYFFSILAILLIYVKREKDYMMAIEYSYTCEYSFMMVFMIHIICGAPYLMNIQEKIPGRCFLTFGVCCIIFINFWVRLGWPVYLCLFKNKSEMDSFEEELRSRGAECLGELISATGTSRAARCSFAQQYGGDWILRAIDNAVYEVSERKEKIYQLEQRKVVLSSKIKPLEVSASPKVMISFVSI